MLDFHVSTEVALQVELAGAVRTLEGLTSCVEVHVAQEVVHPVEGLSTHLNTPRGQRLVTGLPLRCLPLGLLIHCSRGYAHLAFERLDGQVDDHVGFEGLLLDEGLEADVALEGPHACVNQHVPLQVGREGELSGTHLTLEFFHTLEKTQVGPFVNIKDNNSQENFWVS